MLVKMDIKMKNITILFEVLYAKALGVIGLMKDPRPIPRNTPYCYTIDNEGQLNVCPYYRKVNKDKSVCTFEGYIGYDVCLHDMCKICGISDNLK